jgi:hypothetical protein
MSAKNTKKTPETTKAKVVKKAEPVDSSSDEEEEQVKVTATKVTKKETEKPKITAKASTVKVKDVTKQEMNKIDSDESDDESEEDDVPEQQADDTSDSEDDSSDEDAEEKKPREKKPKETFEALTVKLDEIRNKKKVVYKRKQEKAKELKADEKEYNDLEREENNIIKLISKCHTDDINRVRKEKKSNRRGNVNGGFNANVLVPEILRSFLDLPEGAMMPRPKVMSAMNNKFTQLGLKDGQTTNIDKATAKVLGLSGPREIKFTEFQSFLKSFFPPKENKVVVDV